MKKIAESLWQSIDIAPLVFFRIAFGSLMLWEVSRYMNYGWVSRYYIQPQFFFHYYGFDWLNPLPADGMIWLFYGLGILAICIILGLAYRLTMALFCLGISYVFLLDQTYYLNHIYLICLLSFLMIFVPAHHSLSIDAWLRPKLRSDTAPAWALWLLRGQMAIVYVYGGIAKLNPDWLLAEPIGTWLSARTSFPFLGIWFDESWMHYLFAYGGLFFDLLIVPLLLYKHSRWGALLLAFGFHAMNGMLFSIGIFPFLAMAGTVIFFPPHYFRAILLLQPYKFVNELEKLKPRYAILGFFALYFAVQLLLPLRHFLYDGYVSWTEEGHTLAWHMKLRSKQGSVFLFAIDPTTGQRYEITLENYLSSRQIEQMRDNPQMLLRFAHYLEAGDYAGMEIRAWSMMALNERAPQLLIDPFVNLAAQPDDLWADDWILPLRQPLPHEPALPTLLLSRRVGGLLIIMNITTVQFPLDNLRLSFGELDFEHETLPPSGCIVLYNNAEVLENISPLCSVQQEIYGEGSFTDFSVYYGESLLENCISLSCTINLPQTFMRLE